MKLGDPSQPGMLTLGDEAPRTGNYQQMAAAAGGATSMRRERRRRAPASTTGGPARDPNPRTGTQRQ